MEDQIINLFSKGYSVDKIAEKLAVYEDYVWNVLIAVDLL